MMTILKRIYTYWLMCDVEEHDNGNLSKQFLSTA